MSTVSTTIYFSEGDLPTGVMNPGGASGSPFPVIRLADHATLAGYSGNQAPYLRKLAEIATELADQIEAAAGGEPA